MFEKRIPMGEGARLFLLDMAGDLLLAGWDEDDLLVRLPGGEEGDLMAELTEKGPALSARARCEVMVPAARPVAIRQVAGNLEARGLRAALDVEQVRGNLALADAREAVVAEVYGNARVDKAASLRLVGTIYGDGELKGVDVADLQNVRGNLRARGVGRLRVSRIGGNLRAQEIGGPLDADQVGGNALLKGLGGALTVGRVAGNLAAQNLAGGARVALIGGDLVLNGQVGRGRSYHFQADGNALVRLSSGAGAHLTLRAGGNLVKSVALVDEAREGATLTGSLGDGGAEVVVDAGGNIELATDRVPADADLGEEIARQVEESLAAIDLEAIGRQVAQEMEAAMSRLQVKLEGMDWSQIGLQAQQAVERAMDRMQRDMDRMVEGAARQQEKLRRRAEREARRAERRAGPGRGWAGSQGRPGTAPGEPARPDSAATGTVEPPPAEEERLSILRMVERGQITPQEAEMLLDALA